MSGGSVAVASFAVADYVVFALMLVVSAAVGFYYAWTDRSQSSSGDFLTGGRRLTALPVSLSLTASFMSAITVLSNPAEVRLLSPKLSLFTTSWMWGGLDQKALIPVGLPLWRQHWFLCPGLCADHAGHFGGIPASLLQTGHHQHL